MNYSLLFTLLSIPLISFCQSGPACRETINQSYAKYEAKDYKAALDLFTEALHDKCPLTYVDYYNGACFASLLKDEKLAFRFLEISVDKGYDDADHMDKDTDLDNIRNKKQYKNLIGKIGEKFKDLRAELSRIKPSDFAVAIPYTENNKWGWLNRQTNAPMTKAIFDYTDFSSGNGLFFVYGSKNYLWTTDRVIKKYNQYLDEFMAPMISSDEAGPSDSPLVKGFAADDRTVTSFSDRFKNVTLIREFDAPEKIAVAVDQEDREGIIREDGSIFKIFDFKFATIDHFLGRFRHTYFVVKEIGSDSFLIYDRNGEPAYNKPITSYRHLYNYQRTPLNQNLYVGTFNTAFLIIQQGQKANVLDQVRLETLSSKGYDKVGMINGPTPDNDKTGSASNQGISEPFFLVSEGAQMFYIDKTGKEYRTK